MALLRIRRGNASELPTSAYSGELLGVLDEATLFMGSGIGNPLIRVSDVVTTDELPQIGVKDKIYISKAENKMFRWDEVNQAFVSLTSASASDSNPSSATLPHVATRSALPTDVEDETIYFIEDENKLVVFEAETTSWEDLSISLTALDDRYYQKSEVNSLLDNKANTANVYGKTETYSQTEVNDLLADKADSSVLEGKANVADVYSKTVTDQVFAKKAELPESIPTYAFKSDFPTPTVEGQTVVDESTGMIYTARLIPSKPGVVDPTDVSLIPAMTKNNLPSPYVAFASKELDTTNTAAYKAFDQKTDAQTTYNYFWTGNSRGTNVDYLGIGKSDGTKLVFNKIAVTSSAAGSNNYPKSAIVEISDDKINWTAIKTVDDMGLTAGDQTYVIDLPQVVSTSYVRLNALRATNYAGGYGPVVKEIQILKGGGLDWVEADFVKKIKNRSRIEVLATNALPITTNTRQIVPFDSVGVDALGEFDKTTYKVTIKESGFFNVSSQLWLTFLGAGRFAFTGLLINGVERRTAQIVGQQLAPADGSSGYPAPQTVLVHDNLWLNAGDTVQVFVTADCKAGDTTTVSNTSTTRFTLNRLY